MIVNTIGTASRDFSTPQLWEDSIPGVLADAYEGRCYNDSEFTGRLSIAGHTTTSTNTIRLTAAAGHSFQDHANVRTNALFYDQSKGVGIHANPGSAGSVIDIDCDNVFIDRLQIKRSAASYTNTVVNVVTNNFPNVIVRDCLVEKAFSANVPAVVIRCGKAINLLVVNSGVTVGTGIFMYEYYGNRGRAINCTIVNVAAAGGTGIESGGLSTTDNFINNCAVFGYSTASLGSTQGDYNATDRASGLPGAHSVFNLIASDQFVSAANDFRLKSGSALIGAGNTDATNAPNDITGFARGSGTLGDIGVWEAVSTANANVSSVTDAESVPTVQALAGVQSVSITLKSDSSTLLANKALRVWTRNTIDGAAVDGGSSGLAFSTNSSGVLNVTGLMISTGVRILTVQDPSDPLNSHNYPVTVV